MNYLKIKKQEQGITLIALIITIIILVILAAVSIRAVYNMQIVNYAVNGSQDYRKATKEENKVMQDTKSYLESITTRIKNAQITVPDNLRKYVLGENEEGRLISEIFNNISFIDDTNSIPDASTSVIFLNKLLGDFKQGSNGENRFYIKYNNVGYRITTNNSTSKTTGVEFIYVPNGREGEIVQYSVDGSSTKTDWLVLYDNGNTLDITPLNIDSSWTYNLGTTDSNATGSTDIEKSIDSYNNAVERLNTFCNTIITNPNKQAVRSIGTKFDITDTTEKYSSDFLVSNPTSNPGAYNGVAKIGNFNAEQDVIRIGCLNQGGTGAYAITGKNYWIANSRFINDTSVVGVWRNMELVKSIEFIMGFIRQDDGRLSAGWTLWSVNGNGASGGYGSTSMYVRPVVRVLSSDV